MTLLEFTRVMGCNTVLTVNLFGKKAPITYTFDDNRFELFTKDELSSEIDYMVATKKNHITVVC